MPKHKPKLPATDEVLAAMGQHALKGKQGRVAAGRAYLDHVAGRPVQKSPQNELHISEDTLKRCVAIAERLAAKCMHCGQPVGMASSVPESHAEDVGGFRAYEPQPEPAKVEAQDSEPEKVVLPRQPKIDRRTEQLETDHRGFLPRL